MGAHHVINYVEKDFVKEIWKLFDKPDRRGYDGGVDMVVNFTGGDTWVPSMKCLRRGGRMLTCGATAGHDPATDLRYIWTYRENVDNVPPFITREIHDIDRLRDTREDFEEAQ